jgi:hypothetical protein
MIEEDEDDKVIGRIYPPPGYGLAYVEMMKSNYRQMSGGWSSDVYRDRQADGRR